MVWKRRTHDRQGTTLIETYSYEFTEGSLIENLTRKLTGAGITLDPMTPEKMWEEIQRSARDEVASFIDLVSTFLSLLKSNGKDLAQIKKKSRTNEDEV